MKLIFLDFDGVISSEDKHFQCFDEKALGRLDEIMNRTGAKIVVTSTWRKRYGISDMRGLFRHQGDRYGCYAPEPHPFEHVDCIIGITPSFDSTMFAETKEDKRKAGKPYGRGEEISYWLDTAVENGLHVESYVVLDDDTADIPPHRDRQVVTDSLKGLQDEDIEKAVEILDRPMEK